ncbi:hypothetical protein QBC35DRAFT_551299 [Podospora australis]|uniref:DUF6594 domain-containing protein n=1 Tax=Podospora australis TaxID=1536484 RepID=A0AAN6WH72_9PEZI|nr:hypothetical protein QBC35DRAFT_551299 [Podospora australis]
MSEPLEKDDESFVKYVNRSLDEEEDFHFPRFEFLQRLNITQLEVKLVRMKSQIQKQGKASPQSWKTFMTAIRDYRDLKSQKSLDKSETKRRNLLMQRFFQSKDDFNDPFQSHYAFFKDGGKQIDLVRRALMKYLPARLAYSDEERRQRNREYIEGKPPRGISRFVDRLVRFIIALTCGTFLIMPMIIMTLSPSQTKSLVTVSVAVVVFTLVVNKLLLLQGAIYHGLLCQALGVASGLSGANICIVR